MARTRRDQEKQFESSVVRAIRVRTFPEIFRIGTGSPVFTILCMCPVEIMTLDKLLESVIGNYFVYIIFCTMYVCMNKNFCVNKHCIFFLFDSICSLHPTIM